MTTRVYLKWLNSSCCKGELVPVDLDLPEEFTDGEMMRQVRERTEFVDGIRVSDADEIRREVMRARRGEKLMGSVSAGFSKLNEILKSGICNKETALKAREGLAAMRKELTERNDR